MSLILLFTQTAERYEKAEGNWQRKTGKDNGEQEWWEREASGHGQAGPSHAGAHSTQQIRLGPAAQAYSRLRPALHRLVSAMSMLP